MIFNEDTLDRYKNVTGFDVDEFIQDFIEFNGTYKQNIVAFYSGVTQTPDSISFDFMKELINRSTSILTLVSLNKDSFSNFSDWNMLELLEDIDLKLQTTNNISKFLRSAITSENYNPKPQLLKSLKQFQSLEMLAGNELNSPNPQDDWADIAIKNNLKEEDYDYNSGNLLKVSFIQGGSLLINSVVDNIDTGEKTYGLDIQKKIEFDSDQNDIKILSYQDTKLQSIDTLVNLKKNDNPEFPDQGYSQALVVGSNIGSLAFPSLFRQLYNTFSTDDSFKSFSITNVKRDQDALFIEYEVQTRAGEIEKGNISI